MAACQIHSSRLRCKDSVCSFISRITKRPFIDRSATSSSVDKARLLAADFARRAGVHDRDASFPFENFQALSDAGLLSLTVPRERGGLGAGMLESMRVLNEVARG